MISLNPTEAKNFLIRTEAKNTGMIETTDYLKLFFPISQPSMIVECVPREGEPSYYLIDKTEFLDTI